MRCTVDDQTYQPTYSLLSKSTQLAGQTNRILLDIVDNNTGMDAHFNNGREENSFTYGWGGVPRFGGQARLENFNRRCNNSPGWGGKRWIEEVSGKLQLVKLPEAMEDPSNLCYKEGLDYSIHNGKVYFSEERLKESVGIPSYDEQFESGACSRISEENLRSTRIRTLPTVFDESVNGENVATYPLQNVKSINMRVENPTITLGLTPDSPTRPIENTQANTLSLIKVGKLKIKNDPITIESLNLDDPYLTPDQLHIGFATQSSPGSPSEKVITLYRAGTPKKIVGYIPEDGRLVTIHGSNEESSGFTMVSQPPSALSQGQFALEQTQPQPLPPTLPVLDEQGKKIGSVSAATLPRDANRTADSYLMQTPSGPVLVTPEPFGDRPTTYQEAYAAAENGELEITALPPEVGNIPTPYDIYTGDDDLVAANESVQQQYQERLDQLDNQLTGLDLHDYNIILPPSGKDEPLIITPKSIPANSRAAIDPATAVVVNSDGSTQSYQQWLKEQEAINDEPSIDIVNAKTGDILPDSPQPGLKQKAIGALQAKQLDPNKYAIILDPDNPTGEVLIVPKDQYQFDRFPNLADQVPAGSQILAADGQLQDPDQSRLSTSTTLPVENIQDAFIVNMFGSLGDMSDLCNGREKVKTDLLERFNNKGYQTVTFEDKSFLCPAFDSPINTVKTQNLINENKCIEMENFQLATPQGGTE